MRLSFEIYADKIINWKNERSEFGKWALHRAVISKEVPALFLCLFGGNNSLSEGSDELRRI